eukprot:gene24816-biopygen7430
MNRELEVEDADVAPRAAGAARRRTSRNGQRTKNHDGVPLGRQRVLSFCRKKDIRMCSGAGRCGSPAPRAVGRRPHNLAILGGLASAPVRNTLGEPPALKGGPV